MLSRALSLATVTFLVGCLAALPLRAQNLEAGKSPSQIFAGTCTACHKAPRGLLKTIPAGSLPGFLRQHYTTSSEMASSLSGYLVSNGATDTRVGGPQPKQGKDAKSESTRPESGERQGRNAKRQPGPDLARPGVEGQTPAQAAIERGPDGRRLAAKHRLGRRGNPVEEPPKADLPKDAPKDLPKDEASRSEPAKDSPAQSDTAKDEVVKPEAAPSPADASETAKASSSASEPAGTAPTALRPDPVPEVTPAPTTSEAPVQTTAAPTPAVSPAPGSTASDSPPGPSGAQPAPVTPAAVAASTPPETVTPAGPPAPPISQ
jgi:hypothetical protein